ncbi:MAG: Flp family type IVb pilin [Pirellulaceae bacterium]|nr:Flp family type IVb pilin [Pirellulaceae bacterium]
MMVMLKRFKTKLERLIQEEDGPTAVEYAVMLSMIIAVCIGSVRSVSSATRASFDESAQAITSAASP